MKKKVLLSTACLLALSASAQQETADNRLANINWTEDSTEITTVADIINIQQEVSSRNSNQRHFQDVWGRQNYFNISYNTATVTPKEDIPTGVSLYNGLVPEFKSDWGIALQLGHSYRLHKKPIANTALFNLDFTFIDLGAAHFKAENGNKNLYDSSQPNTITGYYYIPYNLEKYEASFGMNIGPSLTVAPFNYTKTQALHYLKLNVYYHIGYGVSVLYMLNDKDADINQTTGSTNYKTMSDNLKLDWGHGMTSSIGFSLTWKAIGIGYEHRSATMKYKPVTTGDFGDETHKFKTGNSRVFLQIRY